MTLAKGHNCAITAQMREKRVQRAQHLTLKFGVLECFINNRKHSSIDANNYKFRCFRSNKSLDDNRLAVRG